MLVVVEDGDIALRLQFFLDLETPRGRDILEVDAAERAGDQVDRVHELVDVLGLDAKGYGIHAAERLEQHAFAFHDGHAGFGADVAQAEHRGPVRDDRAQVVAQGQVVALAEVLLDLQAGLGHARGVRQGQIVLRGDGYLGDDFYLTFPLFVELEGFFCVIHGSSPCVFVFV